MSSNLQLRISKTRELAEKNNLNLDDLMQLLDDCLSQSPNANILHQMLELAHLSIVSETISISNERDTWLKKIIELIN